VCLRIFTFVFNWTCVLQTFYSTYKLFSIGSWREEHQHLANHYRACQFTDSFLLLGCVLKQEAKIITCWLAVKVVFFGNQFLSSTVRVHWICRHLASILTNSLVSGLEDSKLLIMKHVTEHILNQLNQSLQTIF
jgi:hypothetical protein